jgi:hypothetical protein
VRLSLEKVKKHTADYDVLEATSDGAVAVNIQNSLVSCM